jgi:hypothetical protein
MYLEFVVGPVLSLLIALKFGDMKNKEREKEIAALQAKVELLEGELPKKVMATMLPVAKAVQKLNAQVGL